jgi:hypothetical protein
LSDGSNGGLASNYILASGQTASASITPAAVNATVSASDKVYDGNSIADATLMLDGLISNETLGVSSTANFNSKDVGAAQLVTVDSVTLSDGANGGLASNYSLASGQTVAANILPRELIVVGSTALDKIYDGTTIAILTGGSLAGVVANETVELIEVGNFATADVGSAIAVTASNALRGEAAANYILVQPIGLSASITAAPIPPVVAEPILPVVPPPVLPRNPGYFDALGHVSATVASSTTVSGTPSASASSASGASIPSSTALTGFTGLDLTVIGSGIHMPQKSEPADRIGAGTSNADNAP